MSEAVGVRVLRRLSQALKAEGVTQSVCITFPDLEEDIITDLARAVRSKKYKDATKQANELVFLTMAQNELCMWRKRPRSNGSDYSYVESRRLPAKPMRLANKPMRLGRHRRHR